MASEVHVERKIDFLREDIESFWPDAEVLFQHHHSEVGVLEGEKFSPSLEWYKKIQDAGISRLFTVRVDSELVGYNLVLVVPHHHYGGMTWAAQDVLFVSPAYRGRLAVRFIRWVDEQIHGEGVNIIHRHVNEKSDYSSVLESDGYELVERGYIKRF